MLYVLFCVLCVMHCVLCVVFCELCVVVCCVLCVVGRARCVVGKKGCRGFARPPINVLTTGQRGIGAYVLQAAKPAAKASLVSTCRPIMKQD